MLLDEHVKWSPWIWEQLVGLWEGIASWWVGEDEDPPPESLTDAQRGPPPASSSCGNVVITGNVCVSLISNLQKYGRCCNPRPYASITARILHQLT